MPAEHPVQVPGQTLKQRRSLWRRPRWLRLPLKRLCLWGLRLLLSRLRLLLAAVLLRPEQSIRQLVRLLSFGMVLGFR